MPLDVCCESSVSESHLFQGEGLDNWLRRQLAKCGSCCNDSAKKKRGVAFVSVHWLVAVEKAVEKEKAHDTFLMNPGNERKPHLPTFASASWCF